MNILAVFSILILVTGCSPTNMEFATDSGSALIGPPENTKEETNNPCVAGKKLGVWLDANQDGSIAGEKYLGSFVAYSGSMSAAANYNYFSASAHPIVGPIPKEFKTTVFFYEDSIGINFNFFSNVDAGGSMDNIVEWDIKTSDNGKLDKVLLSDDGGELSKKYEGTDYFRYEARFHYYSNTDGGVIGPFKSGAHIAVKVLNVGDVIDAGFFSANGDVLPLSDGSEPVSSFIVGYQGDENCNKE